MARYDGKPPGVHAPLMERYANRRRLAVCFHCRCVIRIDQDAADGTFMEHFDAPQDYYDVGFRGRRRHNRRLNGRNEVCPGSHTMPVPLAYKFPDGEPLPYYSRY
jgi:hypothetical protein